VTEGSREKGTTPKTPSSRQGGIRRSRSSINSSSTDGPHEQRLPLLSPPFSPSSPRILPQLELADSLDWAGFSPRAHARNSLDSPKQSSRPSSSIIEKETAPHQRLPLSPSSFSRSARPRVKPQRLFADSPERPTSCFSPRPKQYRRWDINAVVTLPSAVVGAK
jgi:hypothetical protein